MQLVLVEELVKAAGTCVVLFVLLVHDADVFNELVKEASHALGRSNKLHDLVEGAVRLCVAYGPMDLIVLLIAFQRRRWVEVFVTEPIELLIDVLLGEHKDLELL